MSGRVTLKLATSLDGRIATAAGESRWITGEAAREQAHRLRADHDAVLVGIGTVLADDPELTVRLPGYAGPQPARVVLDTDGRLPLTSKLARTAKATPVWVFGGPGKAASAAMGVRVVAGEGRPVVAEVVRRLADEGFRRVFVEGGGQVAASFIRAGAVDAIEWFRAPILLGEEGRSCLAGLAVAALADAPRFRRLAVYQLGDDLWERYERLPL